MSMEKRLPLFLVVAFSLMLGYTLLVNWIWPTKPKPPQPPKETKKQQATDFNALLNKLTAPDKPVKTAKAGPRVQQQLLLATVVGWLRVPCCTSAARTGCQCGCLTARRPRRTASGIPWPVARYWQARAWTRWPPSWDIAIPT